MINTIFWDFDGTLVNTNDVIIASWQETYKHYYGHEMPLERITRCFGEPLLLTMEREFPGVDPEESANVYRTYQSQHADSLVKEFEGVRAVLEDLKARRIGQYIVTSRTRESALRYLRMLNLEEYFDDMISCEDTSIHKPNPEPIYLALKKAGREKDEVIMIGDGPFDIKCANNAGVKSILVGWRITSDKDALIDDSVPDYETETPEDLKKLLLEITNTTI